MPAFDKITPMAHRTAGQEEDTRAVLARKLIDNAPKAEVVATFMTWLYREGQAAPWQVLMQRIAEGDDPDTAFRAAEEYGRDVLSEVRELVTGSPIMAAAATAECDGFRTFLAAKPSTGQEPTTGQETTMPTETKTPAAPRELPDPLPTTTYAGDGPGLYDVLLAWPDRWEELRDRLCAQVGDEAKAARIWVDAEAQVQHTMDVENVRTDLYAAVATIAERARTAQHALDRLRGTLYDVEYAEGDTSRYLALFLTGIRRDALGALAMLPTGEHGDMK